MYPHKFDTCNKKMRILGKLRFRQYIENRAKATVIHEILHLKYEDNEPKVKELTKRCYSIYSNHNPKKSTDYATN